jgi:cytochrome c-type biogenesis protein CcsB
MTGIASLFAQAESTLFVAQLGFLVLALLASALCDTVTLARRAKAPLAALALAAVLASAAIRSVGAGRLPFASVYEFGLLLCIALDALLLFAALRYEERAISLAASVAAFVLGTAMLFFFQKARPLAPALKSAWLGLHVATAVIAYACLAVSAALGVAGLAALREEGEAGAKTGKAARIETLMSRLIAAAFPFLTLLIVTGAIWAEYAWGAFWRWDPKETWALVTWLAYLACIHLTRVRGWRGRRAFALSVACFAIVLFTFFGVNFLMPGLHSYVR